MTYLRQHRCELYFLIQQKGDVRCFVHGWIQKSKGLKNKWASCTKYVPCLVCNTFKSPYLVLSCSCGVYYFLIAIRTIYLYPEPTLKSINPVARLLHRTFIFSLVIQRYFEVELKNTLCSPELKIFLQINF